MKKKGIMFTLLSIIMAAFFILLFSAPLELPLDIGSGTTSFRISIIDRYTQSWEDFVASAVRVSAYRALESLGEHVDDSLHPLFSTESEFKRMFTDCMANGSMERFTYIPGYSGPCPGMQTPDNATLPFWLNQVANVSWNELNINTTYEIRGVDVWQVFPFHAFVQLNISYKIKDSFATVSRNITVTELISLEGLREPLGADVLSSASQTRRIVETGILDSEWTTGRLAAFVENKEYRFSSDAPSFIQRFYGDTSGSSCCGIEAVLSEDIDSITPLINGSYIDHYYLIDINAPTGSRFKCDEAFTVSSNATLFNLVYLDQEKLTSFNSTPSDWITWCFGT